MRSYKEYTNIIGVFLEDYRNSKKSWETVKPEFSLYLQNQCISNEYKKYLDVYQANKSVFDKLADSCYNLGVNVQRVHDESKTNLDPIIFSLIGAIQILTGKQVKIVVEDDFEVELRKFLSETSEKMTHNFIYNAYKIDSEATIFYMMIMIAAGLFCGLIADVASEIEKCKDH